MTRPFVVVYAPPVRSTAAIPAVLATLPKVSRPGTWKRSFKIVDHMEDRIVARDLHDRAIRENQLHRVFKYLPLHVAVEIVGHEEAAAQQVFAHFLALLRRQSPLANLNRIDPWQVELFVFIQIDRLFRRTNMDASQTANGLRKVTVGTRIILRPERQSQTVIPGRSAPSAVAVIPPARKHQARERELGLFLRVRRRLEGRSTRPPDIAGKASGRRKLC